MSASKINLAISNILNDRTEERLLIFNELPTVHQVKKRLRSTVDFIKKIDDFLWFGYYEDNSNEPIALDDEDVLEGERYDCDVLAVCALENKLKHIKDQKKGNSFLARIINAIEVSVDKREFLYDTLVELIVKNGYPLDKLRAKAKKLNQELLLSTIEDLSGNPNDTPCSALKSFLKYSLNQFKRLLDCKLEHSTNKGTLREAFVELFVKKAIDSQLLDCGNGEIFSPTVHCKKQLDIVIYEKKKNPLIFYDKQNPCLYFAESVLAIIEVKSVLNTSSMKQAMDAAIKVKEINKNIKYLVFVYSNTFTEQTIIDYLQDSNIDGLFLLDGKSYRLLGTPPLTNDQYAHHPLESLAFYNSKVWAVSREPLIGLSVVYGLLVKLGTKDRWIDKYIFKVY